MRSWLTTIGVLVAGCSGMQLERDVPVNNAYGCNAVVNDQSTTGGLPVTLGWIPCWDPSEEILGDRDYVAAVGVTPPSVAEASTDLGAGEVVLPSVAVASTDLADAATAACEKIAPSERDHSPFAHGKEISQVTPTHGATGETTGVKVVFKPVRGLTAQWMRDDIACQRARWHAVGQDPKLAPHDPTLVEGAHVQVADLDGRVEVTVTAERPEQAELAAARAAGALTRPTQSARR